jgi:hypothetical protein
MAIGMPGFGWRFEFPDDFAVNALNIGRKMAFEFD